MDLMLAFRSDLAEMTLSSSCSEAQECKLQPPLIQLSTSSLHDEPPVPTNTKQPLELTTAGYMDNST